jgi:hypothetical protein
MIPFDKWNIQHNNEAELDVSEVMKLYSDLILQAGAFASSVVLDFDIFKFKKFPALEKKIDALLSKHAFSVQARIESGINKHWEISQTKNDLFTKKAFKKYQIKTDPIATRNAEGLTAYRNRRNRKLSSRVWNLNKQFRNEIEMSIDTAIKSGKPANQLATELKKYLNEPEKLFRKYKDNNGLMQLSKNAKAYRSGQGVYKSSFKNAQRLARTEINMAYRLSDLDRWSRLDFIIGYEIKRSNNPFPCPTCEMMKGNYPKDFVWSGNHPSCRCYLVPIMKKEEDFIKSMQTGESMPFETTPINPKFTKFISDNQNKLQTAKSLPYFIKDNTKYVKFKKPASLKRASIEEALSNGSITENIFMVDNKYSPERQLLHNKIISEYLNVKKVSSDKIYMLGGATANGKSTVINSGKLPHKKGSLVLDPDKIKEMIPEYNIMLKSGDAAMIKGAANFVHEESSYLGKIISKRALTENYGVVVDGVNDGAFEKVASKVKEYKKLSGKKIRADYVSLDTDLSIKLAKMRSDKTGREVPIKFIKDVNIEVSLLVPKLLKNNTFDELYLWDTNINGVPRLILKQIEGKLTMYDNALYQRFLKKAN